MKFSSNPLPQVFSVSRQMKCDIFLSLRFSEALPEAESLKVALVARGLTVFLAAVQSGDSIVKEVSTNLVHCKLVVILGTRTYGKETTSSCSTFEELQYVMSKRKPFFLIKMCDEFEEVKAQFHLVGDIAFEPWRPTEKNPEPPHELVEKIMVKFKGL